MNIETDFVSNPIYSKTIKLENWFTLYLNWNVFKDIKDDNNLVLRVRYVLYQGNGRVSLKLLNLKQNVEFKQIYVTDDVMKDLNISLKLNLVEHIIDKHFGEWLRTDFIEMINSGTSKIINHG